MKKFNKITNPKKFKSFISLIIIFSSMNNLTIFGSEKKSALLKIKRSENKFEESYFKNSIPYNLYDNSESQVKIFFGKWRNPNRSENTFYPDLSIINTSESIREIYKSKLNDMSINKINIMSKNEYFKN